MKGGTRFPPIVSRKGSDINQKGSSNQRERQRFLPPSLLKIDGTDKIIVFNGFPASLPFTVGGKNGNIVTSSFTTDVLKSWRIVAINGTRPPNGNISSALAHAQTKHRKFAITFRFGDELTRSVSDGCVFVPKADDEVQLKQLAHHDNDSNDREDISQMTQLASNESERFLAEEDEEEANRLKRLADEKETRRLALAAEEAARSLKEDAEEEGRRLAAATAAAAAAAEEAARQEEVQKEAARLKQLADEEEATRQRAEQAAREMAEKLRNIETAVGLPSRATVEDTTQVLLTAMSKGSRGRKERRTAPLSSCTTPAAAGPCDKCDGPHHESVCPHFKGRTREKHKDATDMYHRKLNGGNADIGHSSGADCNSIEPPHDPYSQVSSSAVKVIPQPGDGSCLFHSMSHALGALGHLTSARNRQARVAANSAAGLRLEIENYIAGHPDETIGGTTISDWVLWDSQVNVATYAARMRYGNGWGGAVEIAVCARLMGVVIQVFERKNSHFVRISRFEPTEISDDDEEDVNGTNSSTTHLGLGIVNILYGGRCHYDALKVSF